MSPELDAPLSGEGDLAESELMVDNDGQRCGNMKWREHRRHGTEQGQVRAQGGAELGADLK